MSPRDVLAVAEELCDGATEAFWRAAIGRGYFAAFHAARQLLQQAGFTVPEADRAHGYLWLRLCNCGHPEVVAVGVSLKALRGLRNRADYDLDQPVSHRAAIVHVDEAARLLELLETVPGSASFAAITEAMKIYERDVLRVVTWKS